MHFMLFGNKTAFNENNSLFIVHPLQMEIMRKSGGWFEEFPPQRMHGFARLSF